VRARFCAAIAALGLGLALAIALAMALAVAPGAGAMAAPQVSLTDIEDQVMCVSCHTPLAVSESPQGNAERDFIRSLIARGDSKQKILDELVAQYGPGVVYILPPAALLAGLAGLVYALPRWRRRAPAAGGAGAAGAPGAGAVAGSGARALTPEDAHRLDEELSHFDG
jgi:cytochrome c-type biogenesis protein CcmH/NrfF